jgi:PIN domain
MLYLTFDTNIWIYLLDDCYKSYNPVDHLEHWLNENHIGILLPQVVIEEWERNRDNEIHVRKKTLREFFYQAEEIYPTAESRNRPSEIDAILTDQFGRIEKLIYERAIRINPPEHIYKKIVDWGVLKKAPMHKKSSLADAMIVFSFIDFVEKNANDEFIFISGNKKDFFESAKRKTIHSDLQKIFTEHRIDAYHNLGEVVAILNKRFPSTINIEAKRKARIRNKFKEQVYRKEILEAVEDVPDTYLENKKVLDSILSLQNPTKQQVLVVLGMIEQSQDLKTYFYRNVNLKVWFPILNRLSHFDPKHNPQLKKVEDGFLIPNWEVLIFLEKLSIQIKESGDPKYVEDIISIVKQVSAKPNDNYKTWYFIIKILSNLPNESITEDILNFIPTWLSGQFDNSLQSAALTESLFPKFLNDSTDQESLNKAEKILLQFLQLEISKNSSKTPYRVGHRYKPKVDFFYIHRLFERKEIINAVARNISDSVILHLGKTIKVLLLDYELSERLQHEGSELLLQAEIRIDGLFITVGEGNTLIKGELWRDYEAETEQSLVERIIEFLKRSNISHRIVNKEEDPVVRICYAIFSDVLTKIRIRSIAKIDQNYRPDNLLETFILFFCNVLNERIKTRSNGVDSIFEELFYSRSFNLPTFKRIAIYLIGENWDHSKSLFWRILGENDSHQLLTKHDYQNEMFQALSKVQTHLFPNEIDHLERLIQLGPQDAEKNTNEALNYWRLSWYSALSKIEPFLDKYKNLSKLLNINSGHFKDIGEVKVHGGSVSPISGEELMKLPDKDIALYINSFVPTGLWDDPTSEGLANTLQSCVEQHPDRFSKVVSTFSETPYLYAYHLVYGFINAWRSQKKFDWSSVLEFCVVYVADERFYSGKFGLKHDELSTKSEWVIGAIANLLSTGMQNDESAFNLSLLPKAKGIIQSFAQQLQYVEFKKSNMDYPMYSLNSTAGKVLRALLDYSLIHARNFSPKSKAKKWDNELKALFEASISKGIIDPHIFVGMYYQQFYFLDDSWTIEQIRYHYNCKTEEWLAFLGGFAFASPPWNKQMYQLFYPHYEKAITDGVEIYTTYNNGLISHLTAFYFWGFENLADEKLTVKFILSVSKSNLLSFINYITRQKEYCKELTETDKVIFLKRISELWDYLLLITRPDHDESKKIQESLADFIVYFDIVDEINTNRLLRSIPCFRDSHAIYELLIHLDKVKNNGNPNSVANQLGRILNAIKFDYYISLEINPLKSLVTFLFENGQGLVAKGICNELARRQYDFLNNIYEKYN